jgi:nitrogen fixation/metabolism regulation signal transduction histidine kinase
MQEIGAGSGFPLVLDRDRPLWKTLVVGAAIAYSPLVAAFVVLSLTLGTFATSGGTRTLFGGLTFVSGVVSVVLYLVAAGVAVIYVDRRHEAGTFSFWAALRSVVLFYLAVVLPFVVIAAIVVATGVLGGRS